MLRLITLILLSISLTLPGLTFAWERNGHRIVAQIAQNHLTTKAQHNLTKLIGDKSLAQIANWPDEIKPDPKWQYTFSWHFINIGDNQTYQTSPKNPAGDVAISIEHFCNVLRKPKVSHNEKLTALKFLVHLVGDIHQPLHVGRHSDQGGNTIKVNWVGTDSNLHEVWDEGIIESERLSYMEFTRFIDHPSKEEIKKWQHSGVLDWVKESENYRSQVYSFGKQADSKKLVLGFPYAYKNEPIIKKRLLQGGVRLAGLLNSIFK